MTPSSDNKNQWLTVANGITLIRIIGTVALLFISTMSPLFLSVYTVTGLTDALDGFVARKTGTQSDFGARLDSAADLIFYAVMLIKLMPVLWVMLPKAIWYGAAAALLIRIGAYITAGVKFRRFSSLHTYLNKITGAAAFLIPYMLLASWYDKFAWAVCALAVISSLEELVIHALCKEYNPNRKSVFLCFGRGKNDSAD